MDEASRHVLVVEDSRLFGKTLRQRFESELHFDVTLATTYSEAAHILDSTPPDYFVAVLDLDLPDASGSKIVELIQSRQIPAIVYTAGVSEGLREDLWARRVVDYVLKGSSNSLDYLSSLVKRMDLNRDIKLLVVDDSAFMRKNIIKLLEAHQYKVLEAADGVQALATLKDNPEIRLVLTDYSMPNMDGIQLTEAVRTSHNREDLAIIGVSTSGNAGLSARFLKSGANDFIRKPFLAEEFYCRITQNIETLEHIAHIRRASYTDYLTGLCNRRSFFTLGKKLHANAARGDISIAVGMIDIDYFKKVNDTYGHEAGDQVLKRVANILKARFRQADVVSRFGGEEFCILLSSATDEQALCLFEGIRHRVEREVTRFGDQTIHVTISIGVCTEFMDSLENIIQAADECLYKAKKGGRNRVHPQPAAQ
jgi:diguanylate cyclase (GGDEF)-like protein